MWKINLIFLILNALLSYNTVFMKNLTNIKNIDEFIDEMDQLSDDEIGAMADDFYEHYKKENEGNPELFGPEVDSYMENMVRSLFKEFFLKAREDPEVREKLREQLKEAILNDTTTDNSDNVDEVVIGNINVEKKEKDDNINVEKKEKDDNINVEKKQKDDNINVEKKQKDGNINIKKKEKDVNKNKIPEQVKISEDEIKKPNEKVSGRKTKDTAKNVNKKDEL